MFSIVYNIALKRRHIKYRSSSAIEFDSGSSFTGSTLMIFEETYLNITFTGMSIAIYGGSISLPNSSIGSLLDSEKNVSIDGIPIKATSFAKSNGGLLYETPKLPEGSHSLSFSNISNVYIDYMLVTPGNQTEILGETLLVDNSDSNVSYEGDWVRESTANAVRNAEVRMPIVNSSMRSNSPGASVSFPFTGTAVSVFGSCGREQDISSVDVYLDGVLAPKTAPNYDEVRHTVSPLFSMSGLSKASHTLKLLLVSNDSASSNLSIDHFTYAPSFPSFGTKLITNRSPTAPTNEVLILSTPTHSPSAKPNGARLAGLIFGVIGIALFLALLIFRRRIFKRRVRPPPETRPFALGSHRKDATAEQTPQKQEQRLPPNTTGRPLRGILKNQSESRPVLEVKALPHEANPPVTGKAIKINSPTLPARKESSSQPPSDQASPV